MKNEYLPYPARIEIIRRENVDSKTLRVSFEDGHLTESFTYQAGQFMELSLPGIGEAPISITSSPGNGGCLEFTIRAAGKLTRAIANLKPGERIFLRGPYGRAFPVERIRNKNLSFVAGGIGLAPLRSLINEVFRDRREYGTVTILYGARTPDGLCFKDELEKWRAIPDVAVLLTVDQADAFWTGNVGVVTALWDRVAVDPSNSAAFVCGPPVMMKYVFEKLAGSGIRDDMIFATLERHMKCGIGKCGHCAVGPAFVCTDGPVFSLKELRELPEKEFER